MSHPRDGYLLPLILEAVLSLLINFSTQVESEIFFGPGPDNTAKVGTPPPKLDLFYPKLPPIGPAGYDGTEHQGSYDKYREVVKRMQLKKYPNQEYRVPVTCAQDIGWWLPLDRSVKPEDAIPWMRTPRYPQLRSPMTKFVDRMGISNPLFTMF